MGLFRDVGRRVERFKKQAASTAEEGASHECRDCGERLYAARDRCPDCGSEAVVERAAPDAADEEGTDEERTGDASADADGPRDDT